MNLIWRALFGGLSVLILGASVQGDLALVLLGSICWGLVGVHVAGRDALVALCLVGPLGASNVAGAESVWLVPCVIAVVWLGWIRQGSLRLPGTKTAALVGVLAVALLMPTAGQTDPNLQAVSIEFLARVVPLLLGVIAGLNAARIDKALMLWVSAGLGLSMVSIGSALAGAAVDYPLGIHKNTFGGYVGLLIVALTVYAFEHEARPGGELMVLGLGLLLSGSRGALFATAVALLWYFAWRRRGRRLAGRMALGKRWRRAIVLAAVTAGCIVAYRALVVGEAFRGGTRSSVSTRLSQFDLGTGLWLERPFFGHGLGTSQTLGRDQFGNVVHNVVVEALVEVGLVGLVLMLGAFPASAWIMRSASARNRGLYTMLLAVIVYRAGHGLVDLWWLAVWILPIGFLIGATLGSAPDRAARRVANVGGVLVSGLAGVPTGQVAGNG